MGTLAHLNYLGGRVETMQLRETARDLKNALSKSSQSWRDYSEDVDSKLLWTLLNKLVFVLDGDEPTFVAATAGEPNGKGHVTVELVIYTDSYLLHAIGDMERYDLGIDVIPRSTLTRFTVLTAPPVLESDWNNHEEAGYVLEYKIGARFNLPLGPGATHESKKEISSLARVFKKQLLASA